MPPFFDPRLLGPVIGGGLNPTSGSAFMRGWQRAQQEFEQRQQREQQTARQTQQDELAATREQRMADAQQQQLMLQAEAAERAREQQRLAAANSVRQLLEDPTIEDPAQFEQRLAFAQQYAPQLGMDPGFIGSLRPAPTVFEQRQARAVVKEIESAPQIRKLIEAGEDIGSQIFEKKGQRRSLNEWRALAQAATPVGALPRPTKTDVPNTPEEQFYQQYAAERGAKTFIDLPTAEQAKARAAWATAGRAPDDPVLGELRQMRLDQAKNAANATQNLPPAVQRRVDIKTRAFDQQPVVKRIQTMAEAVTFAEGLDANTTNPADDQALIYAFAKAMDPDSVVREGEYATVQKYAQSWAEQFGFRAARIFSNTPFLTPQARQNMKSTIRARYGAARPQYDNIRRSYSRQISQITGQGDGDSYLIDYAAAFPGEDSDSRPVPSGAGAGTSATPRSSVKVGSIVRDKAGQRARVKGFTPDGKAILEPIN